MQINAQCMYTTALHLSTLPSVCLLAVSLRMLISLSASECADLQSAAHVHHEVSVACCANSVKDVSMLLLSTPAVTYVLTQTNTDSCPCR